MDKKGTKKNIDIRIMRLNKWYVPKSMDLRDCKEPVILGYFDELQIIEPELEASTENLNPFTRGYHSLDAWKNDNKSTTIDYSSQEQILFLNISEEENETGANFSQKTVEDFWDKERKSLYPYLFLSMIHISHSGKLALALQKIKTVFGDNYLSYISYDYCDIVLFAQNLTIPAFMERIKRLFEEPEKVIFDTFSMVSFHPKYEVSSNLNEAETTRIQVTINLSIRDHDAFAKWYQTEISGNELIDIDYDLFGRHDISIIKDNPDTAWLIQIMNKLHDKKNQKNFWTFETFIKIKNDDASMKLCSDTASDLEEIHRTVSERLQDKIEELKVAINESEIIDKTRYILPVYEVRDCICSIVKNSFAEEFVCCIYESFLHFVAYMTKEIPRIGEHPDKIRFQEKKIAEVYDQYFVAMNTLVNSTMHNERQFVQATAFNAVFYSVPPKIMAFYNAYIYRMKQILEDENLGKYTFLIYPSFSPNISIDQISLNATPPCDRILTIRISESALYDIESVMYQMVHELAHYVGWNLRCRDVREEKIVSILVRWVVEECKMEDQTYQILQSCLPKAEDKKTAAAVDGDEKSAIYLDNLSEIGNAILRKLEDSNFIYELYKAYGEGTSEETSEFNDHLLEDCGIERNQNNAYLDNYLEQYATVKCQEFCGKLKRVNEPDKILKYKSYITLIKSVYRECYADLQMIILLGMNAEDYLKTFLLNLRIPAETLLSQPKDLIRVSSIFRTMITCGLWNISKAEYSDSFMSVYQLIAEYNQKVEKTTEQDRISLSEEKSAALSEKAAKFDFENGIRLKGHLLLGSAPDLKAESQNMVPLTAIASGLYEYLLEVLEVSLIEYSTSERAEKIRQARELIKKILCFDDAVEVFNCVEKELISYKREGCHIHIQEEHSEE